MAGNEEEGSEGEKGEGRGGEGRGGEGDIQYQTTDTEHAINSTSDTDTDNSMTTGSTYVSVYDLLP